MEVVEAVVVVVQERIVPLSSPVVPAQAVQLRRARCIRCDGSRHLRQDSGGASASASNATAAGFTDAGKFVVCTFCGKVR